MKRALCIILGLVAITVCFASPVFADGEIPEPPDSETQQNRHRWRWEHQYGEMAGQTEMSQVRLSGLAE